MDAAMVGREVLKVDVFVGRLDVAPQSDGAHRANIAGSLVTMPSLLALSHNPDQRCASRHGAVDKDEVCKVGGTLSAPGAKHIVALHTAGVGRRLFCRARHT
jgi:hypothetical protein